MRITFTAGKRAGTHAEVDDSTGRWMVKQRRARMADDDSTSGPDSPSDGGDDGETKPKRGRPRTNAARAKDVATTSVTSD